MFSSIASVLAFIVSPAYRPKVEAGSSNKYSKTFLKAANIIEKRGWSREMSFGPHGEVCVGVALSQACGGRSYLDVRRSEEAWHYLAEHTDGMELYRMSPAYWNDGAAQSKEHVTDLLRKAADYHD